jgi:hypothetical protein
VAEEKAASAAVQRIRDRTAQHAAAAARPARESLPLSVRAADEYAYVRRDIYRITRIGLLLLAILAVLYVLIDRMGVVTL